MTTDPAKPHSAPERSTRQKRALAAALAGSEQFRSAQDLFNELKASGENIGLTTIYNQLRSLADAGEVDSLRTTSGETLYRRCNSDYHHHHLVCRRCGVTFEVEGPEVERWADRTAARYGFVDITHTVEILGLCADCTSAGADAR